MPEDSSPFTMLSKPIRQLTDLFLKFPGVGPRQATRFVFHLLREDRSYAAAVADAIAKLHDDVKLCAQCYKTYDTNGHESPLCEICRNIRRNQGAILVVEKEADLENIERAGTYDGHYHVLGGTVSPLDASVPAKLHLRELFDRIQKLAAERGTVEVILATNPTSEGDATALYLERVVTPLKGQYPSLSVSRLGRGISTGSELEYSDEVTIANALENRK